MNYKQTTQVPNEVFDKHLPNLTFSELKLLLIIIRQSYGWKTKNGKRKERDRITYSQFQAKTGLSRRVITETVQSLLIKHLISVTAKSGERLHQPEERKGTKYEISKVIAENIPRLKQKLMPKRKAYESEKYTAGVFDAVSLGITYYYLEDK